MNPFTHSGLAKFEDGSSREVVSRHDIFSVEPDTGSVEGGTEITIKGSLSA